MLFLLILIFIVFPVLLIYFAASAGSSSEKDNPGAQDDGFPDEPDFRGKSKDEIHLPARKDFYGNYSDAAYDYALDMDPEELREEDPDLYDEVYGWKANNPEGSGYY